MRTSARAGAVRETHSGAVQAASLTLDGVPLQTTAIAFALALAATFAVWFAYEKTLSIHTFVTTRRESFYWLAVLFTFALGTAAGDLLAEKLALGYWKSALLFAVVIGVVFVSHVKFKLNAILAFWIAYILTRPLGPSIGDYLSQARADGGLALGTTVTSVIFLLTILSVVVYLTITKRDRIERSGASSTAETSTEARVLVVAKTAATPGHVSRWLHVDLPHRVARLGLPVTTVTATHERTAVPA